MNKSVKFEPNYSPTIIYLPGDDFMVVDASVEDNHEVISSVTSHPIEYGLNISDQSIFEPRTFTMFGAISNVRSREVYGDVLSGEFNRKKAAWNILELLMASNTIISIDTNLKRYDNVMLVQLRFIETSDNANCLEFEAVFKEIIIVETRTTGLLNLEEGPTKQQGSPIENRGYIQQESVSDSVSQKIVRTERFQ